MIVDRPYKHWGDHQIESDLARLQDQRRNTLKTYPDPLFPTSYDPFILCLLDELEARREHLATNETTAEPQLRTEQEPVALVDCVPVSELHELMDGNYATYYDNDGDKVLEVEYLERLIAKYTRDEVGQ